MLRFALYFAGTLLFQTSLFVCAAWPQDGNAQEVGALFRYVVDNGNGAFIENVPAYMMNVSVPSQSPCETASVTLTASVTSPELSMLRLSLYTLIPNQTLSGWVVPAQVHIIFLRESGEIIGAQAQQDGMPIPMPQAVVQTLASVCVARLIYTLCILVPRSTTSPLE